MTEKSIRPSGSGTRYTFEVDRRASKPQIRHVIEAQFGVSVKSVNTLIRKGKSKKRYRSRSRTSIAPTKKAVITLAKGQSIAALTVKE